MPTEREISSTGLDPHVAAALAYLAGPLSGVLILLAERTSGYVRFHAWQSIIGLGGLGLLLVLLLGLTFASLIVSATAFRVLLLTWRIGLGLWVVLCLVSVARAFMRRRWKLPIAGGYAERLSRRV